MILFIYLKIVIIFSSDFKSSNKYYCHLFEVHCKGGLTEQLHTVAINNTPLKQPLNFNP
jgi:hypothetical protein